MKVTIVWNENPVLPFFLFVLVFVFVVDPSSPDPSELSESLSDSESLLSLLLSSSNGRICSADLRGCGLAPEEEVGVEIEVLLLGDPVGDPVGGVGGGVEELIGRVFPSGRVRGRDCRGGFGANGLGMIDEEDDEEEERGEEEEERGKGEEESEGMGGMAVEDDEEEEKSSSRGNREKSKGERDGLRSWAMNSWVKRLRLKSLKRESSLLRREEDK